MDLQKNNKSKIQFMLGQGYLLIQKLCNLRTQKVVISIL